ncbi:putative f-box domain protein [Erysiphe neolycopersici]|uniref:Putative f-box domain protein n=1 Tax=Erysiphe neolycopersici TaxID=212602 RepID=A0A420H8V1_9PEZI|nr:putative f-box domain protein [Erysiphe neolycopersici]
MFIKQENLMENTESTKKCNNIFENVPTELRVKITDELYLEDLLQLRLVCQSWYRIFCSNDICIHALQKYFPLPIDYYYEKSSLDCTELEESKKKENWLQRFIINRIRREHGIASRSFYIGQNLWRGDFKFCYSNGRVVFHNRHGFTTEDLITGQQYGFVNPLYTVLLPNWQLSDSYLLAPYTIKFKKAYQISSYSSVALGRELVAWNLVSKEMHSISLSEKVESLSAYKDRVGIVTVSSADMEDLIELYIWYIGNAVTRLQRIEHKRDDSEEQIVKTDIFFSILDKDVIFFVYHTRLNSSSMTKKYSTRVTVQCFEAGAPTQIQHEVIYTSSRPEDYRSTMITNDGIICFEVWENPKLHISRDFHTHITYDMSRRQFNRMEFHLHPSIGRNLLDHKNLIWRDQIYNPSIKGISGEMKELHVITISKSLHDIWNGHLQSACGSSLSSMKSSILCRETREHCSCTENETMNDILIGWPRRVWGDDSFLILNIGESLKVWQFDDLGLEPAR